MTTDQPTPTSSLEEARQSVQVCMRCKGRGGFSDTTMGRGGYGGQMLTGCPDCSGSGIDTRELEAFIEAAARAEVIREVETDTVLDAASKAIHDESAKRVGCSIPWEMHDDGYVERTKQQVAVMLTAVVRALSQGGEGKSDG